MKIVRSVAWWLKKARAEAPSSEIPFWEKRYEFIGHEYGCKAIGGNGDADCTCGAVAFRDGLDRLLR